MGIDVQKTPGGKFRTRVKFRGQNIHIGVFGDEANARETANAELQRMHDGTSEFYDPIHTHTLRGFADEISVSEGTVKRWVHEGMPVKYIGLAMRIDPKVAGEWVAQHHNNSVAIRRRSSVYIVERAKDGAVKIGWTSDIIRRLAELRKDNVDEISLIGSAPADKPIELALHAHFADHRLDGEWFWISANDAFRELVKRVS